MDARRETRKIGIVLGLGLGGFVDGIVLHQVLQWHHLISSTGRGDMTTVAGLEANTLVDGVFHVATLTLTLVGVGMLWASVARRSVVPDRVLLGWALVGWGVFNVLDEAVNHALLDLHHIREGDNELAYDMAFLALGLVQIALGWWLTRARQAALVAQSH